MVAGVDAHRRDRRVLEWSVAVGVTAFVTPARTTNVWTLAVVPSSFTTQWPAVGRASASMIEPLQSAAVCSEPCTTTTLQGAFRTSAAARRRRAGAERRRRRGDRGTAATQAATLSAAETPAWTRERQYARRAGGRVPAASASVGYKRRAEPTAARRVSHRTKVWTALWAVYLIWGSTYLLIAITVETIPPLLAVSTRFIAAGSIMALVVHRRGGTLRVGRRPFLSCVLIGLLLPGANAVLFFAERTVPTGLASLIIASVPLWVVLLQLLGRERIPATTLAGLGIGFAGVAVLLRPSGGATAVGIGLCSSRR